MTTGALLADPEIARIAQEAVCRVEGVASISGGRYARVGTFGTAGIVTGIVVRGADTRDLEVHVNAKFVPLIDLAMRVRAAVCTELAKRAVSVREVDVFIDGIAE
jgi:uncharacterized alkaline shock family protein YloU